MNSTNLHQVCFHTHTNIDPRSWEIIGMSAKETDNPIGQFGSGLKFAIAILLRTGHEVSIHSNGEIYNFSSKSTFFRGEAFDIVTCNGKELGMTTQLGRHWELWMAYRELVCNTMDEGGLHFIGEPMPDGTSIIVKGESFASILSRHEEFFVGDREPITEFLGTKVYKGNGSIFYRGVRVGKLEKARFSYEITTPVKLTEDRTLLNQSSVISSMMMNLCQTCENKAFIEDVITSTEACWEHHQDYDWNWSDTFKEVAQKVWQSDPTKLISTIRTIVPKRLGHKEWKEIEMDERQSAMLKQALDILTKIGYPLRSRVVLIEFNNPGRCGFVSDGDIYVGAAAFTRGMVGLVSTLLTHSIRLTVENGSVESYLISELLERSCAQHKIFL